MLAKQKSGKVKNKKLLSLLFLIAGITSFTFAEPKFNLNLSVVGLTISGMDLKKMGVDWADSKALENIPIIPVVMPTLNVSISTSSAKPAERSLIVLNSNLFTNLSLFGYTTGAESTLSITPLLKLTAFANVQSSWNMKSMKMLSVYNPNKMEYDACTSFSKIAYTFGTKASSMIFLSPYFLQLSYSPTYVGFTGADNKEVWTCGQLKNNVNGWKYTTSFGIGKMFNTEKLKMLTLTASASGYFSDSYFDDIYKPYNPDFVSWVISPTAQFQLTPKQTLIVNAILTRDKIYENDDYKQKEELMQVYDKAQWYFKTIMVIWNIRLK